MSTSDDFTKLNKEIDQTLIEYQQKIEDLRKKRTSIVECAVQKSEEVNLATLRKKINEH